MTRIRQLAQTLTLAMSLIAGLVAGGLPRAGAETVLRAVMHSDLKVIDPIWTSALITTHHGFMVYDQLFALDEKLAIKPQMVDTWETSADKLVWTFTLRDGLAFSDDTPVTTEDVLASLKR